MTERLQRLTAKWKPLIHAYKATGATAWREFWLEHGWHNLDDDEVCLVKNLF